MGESDQQYTAESRESHQESSARWRGNMSEKLFSEVSRVDGDAFQLNKHAKSG